MLIFISQVMSKCLSVSLTFIPLFLLFSKRSVASECSFQQLSPVLLLEVSDARGLLTGCEHYVHILKQATGKISGKAGMQKKKPTQKKSKIVNLIPIKSKLSK